MVFAKEPVPGRVKTRMTPALTAQQAARLYGCLLDDVMAFSLRAGPALGLDVVLAVDPAAACESLSGRVQGLGVEVPPGFQVRAQRGRDLSARLATAARDLAGEGYGRILLRGSDSPLLGMNHLGEILQALEHASVALIPDQGGGYALLGLREPADTLFEVPMSTPEVLRETLAQAEKHGLASYRGEATLDLDTPADLAELSRVLASGRGGLCPRTTAFLSDLAL